MWSQSPGYFLSNTLHFRDAAGKAVNSEGLQRENEKSKSFKDAGTEGECPGNTAMLKYNAFPVVTTQSKPQTSICKEAETEVLNVTSTLKSPLVFFEMIDTPRTQPHRLKFQSCE